MRNFPERPVSPSVTIRVSGSLSQGHLSYLDQLVAAAIECALWPLLEIVAKYTNLPLEQVVGNCAYIDPDGRLDVKDVANQIEWLQGQGFVDKGVTLDAIIARDFVKPD